MKSSTKVLSIILMLSLITIPGCFSLGYDLEQVKQTLIPTDETFDTESSISELPLDTEFEFSIGPIGLFFTYSLLSIVSAIDEPQIDFAKDILNEVGGVQVGVYKINEKELFISSKRFKKAQNQLTDWGFTPIVKHKDENEIVLVYVNDSFGEGDDKMIVLALDQNELVIVNIQADIETLIETVMANEKFGKNINFGFEKDLDIDVDIDTN